MKRVIRDTLPNSRSLDRSQLSRVLRGVLVLACAVIAAHSCSSASSGRRDLPDARTWRFFSEKKIRSRLFFVAPGASDSIAVSDDPACCPVVAPSGRWVACTSFNRKAVENELLVLSRELDRWQPLPGYTAITYSWSPDGLTLAGSGKRRTASSVCFFTVDPIARSAWVADSILTPEDYEFAWDSTSHRIAICRPGSGTKDPPRVLLYSIPDRKMRTVATLTDGTPSSPRWLPADLQVAMAPQMRLAYVGACSPLPCSENDGICPSNSPCSKGVKSAIEEARIPAVIVEVGYQTNPCQECAMRIQPGVIANAVAAGIFNTFITPTFCASPNGPTDARSSAARRTSIVPAPALPAAPRRVATKPTMPTQVLSFSEGFEGATFPPSGWSIQTSGAPPAYAWARTTSTYYVGSGMAAAFIGGGWTSAKDEWLISPAIALGAGDTGLQFSWVGNRVFASEVDVQVLARPSGGGSWTTLWSLSSEPYGSAFAVKTATVSLSTFAGQSIEIALRATGTKGADFSVDDVAVGAFPVSQPPSNDQCANAAQLPLGTFNLTGSTCYAANNMDPSDGTSSACIGYEMDGSDVFYHLAVGVGDTLTAEVQAQWGAGLYVMRSCSGTPTDCVAGAYFEDSDLNPSVNVIFTQAGQYFVVVDAPTGTCGSFQLSGQLRGPTVGVEGETSQERGLQVSPNPMISRAAIAGTFRRAADGQAKLTITDVQGRRVLHRDLPLSRGRVTWEWNRRSADGKRVAPGIYVVELRYGEEVLQSRVAVKD